MRDDLLADLPVSVLFKCELEPNSHPIRHLHVHDLLEIGYCYSGSGVLVVQDRVVPFQAGDASVVNDQEMHMSRGNEESPSRWTYFWIDPAALLAGVPGCLGVANQAPLAGPNFPNILSARAHGQICQLIRDIISELEEMRPEYRIVVRGLTIALMAQLHRLCAERPGAPASPPRIGVERISPALQHMANHYADLITAGELADLCCLSLTQFRRIFAAATGLPPLKYLAQLRIRMAAALLREQPDRPVTDVASSVGFEALNTFNRQFRRTMKMSPREWRQQIEQVEQVETARKTPGGRHRDQPAPERTPREQ